MNIAKSSSILQCTGFHDPEQLFVDGGLIGHNPSLIGGTWAYRLLSKGEVVKENSGVLTLEDSRKPRISNNLTEMLALVNGLSILSWDWRGTVFSDSKITLGRAFAGWHWSDEEMPSWLWDALENQRARLVHWDKIHCGLLDGHPTKVQLAKGFGKRGHHVSEHNLWCDKACGKAAADYVKKLEVVF